MTALNGINQVDLGAREQIEALKEKVEFSKIDAYGVQIDFVNNISKRLSRAAGKTYGNDFDNIKPWRRRRCMLAHDGVVLAYAEETSYTENGLTAVAITKNGKVYPIGTQVQCMVEQPKFWYRVEPLDVENKTRAEVQYLKVREDDKSLGTNLVVSYKGYEESIVLKKDWKADPQTVLAALTSITTGIMFSDWEFTIKSHNKHDFATPVTAGLYCKFKDSTVKPEPIQVSFDDGPFIDIQVIASFNDNCKKLNKANYYISDVPKEGFKLHPAFIGKNEERSYIYLATYLSGIQFPPTGSSGRIISKSLATPNTGIISESEIKEKLAILGIGWRAAFFQGLEATFLLFLIEYATFNMENSGIKTLDMPVIRKKITGGAASLINKSGSKAATINDATSNYISYRGEEDLGYKTGTMLEGIKFSNDDSGKLYICNYDFDNEEAWEPINFRIPIGTGYASYFNYSEKYDWLFVPFEYNGNSSNIIGTQYTIQYFSDDETGKPLLRNHGKGLSPINYASKRYNDSTPPDYFSSLTYIPS